MFPKGCASSTLHDAQPPQLFSVPGVGVAAVTPNLCRGSCFERSQVSHDCCGSPGVAGIPREQAFPFPGSTPAAFPLARGVGQPWPPTSFPCSCGPLEVLGCPQGGDSSTPVWDPAWETQGSGESGAGLGWVNTERERIQAPRWGWAWDSQGWINWSRMAFFFSSLPER